LKKIMVLLFCLMFVTAPVHAASLGTSDLVVVKTVISPPPYDIDDVVLYMIRIRNDGPDVATNVWVKFQFGPGEFIGTDDFYCVKPLPGEDFINCNLHGDLAVGGEIMDIVYVILTHNGYVPVEITAGSGSSDPTPIDIDVGIWVGPYPYSIFLPVLFK
jgi:hypothetical protein